MDAPDEPEALLRRSLLDFIETHWRDLTLRDAGALTVELLDHRCDGRCIKETLTYS
jgi:hypothetical protein